MEWNFPLVITYLGSVLICDRNYRIWVFVVTAWAAKYDEFLFWDVYENFRLWFVPPLVRRYIRDLYLSVALGSGVNYREVVEILDVVHAIDWGRVLVDQALRGCCCQDNSPGHTGTGGDLE